MAASFAKKIITFPLKIQACYNYPIRVRKLATCANGTRQLSHRNELVSTICSHRLMSTGSHMQTNAVEESDECDDLYKEIEIEVKGHDKAVLDSYEQFVTMTARELDLNLANVWTPPRVIQRRSLLKSVHIFKKHRVQYEIRTHFRAFQLKHLTGSTASILLEYIQRNLPEGVAMKVTKHRIEAMPDHIKPPADQQLPSSL